MTILRRARLSLFTRVLRKSPPMVLELAKATADYKDSWAFAVGQDCKWLEDCGVFSSQSNYKADFGKWVEVFSRDPSKFYRIIVKFCSSPFANISLQWAGTGHAGVFSPQRCHICAHEENTTQKLKLHMFKKHGIKDKIRLFVNTTHCEICLKEFHQRENILNHFKKVGVCRVQLLLRPPVLTEEQATQVDASLRAQNRELSRKGKRRYTKELPCFRYPGPFLPMLAGPVHPC